MAPRTLTFADAVTLLGGDTPPGWFDRLTRAGAAVTTVTTVGAVDFFAVREEIAKWGKSAVSGLRERTRGLGRFDRTQRLVAAHSVIVVVAFFEALEEYLAESSIDLAAAALTAAEQVALATDGPPPRRHIDLLEQLLHTPPPVPAPHLPAETIFYALEQYFILLAARADAFLAGLDAFPSVPARHGLPAAAVRRYEEHYRALAAQVPEFGVWSGMIDGQATRTALADAVATLRAELSRHDDARFAAVDGIRAGLSRQHQARMARSALSSSAPPHVTMPTLAQAYVRPSGLLATAGPSDLPATEMWWEDRPRVLDIPAFLLSHLTGAAAVEQPAVVLGQPGAGKSVLTEVLSADLPDTQFMVVRVELRKVHSDASPQKQIEHYLHQTLGEHVSWPDVVRRAHPALPVVIMDGFDELLQATGVNHADYLAQLQEFQRREAELDRPVAVLVTSRTVVADRARFPQGTVVVRLEPFDDEQVAAWLDVWNSFNEHGLQQRYLRPLPAEVAIQHGELARQPLLLLLLALYDAGDNALQNSASDIGRTELYERLFADFIDREVGKHQSRDSADLRQEAIDAEWRRLSAVGLAILNRGGDVIAEKDLDADLKHLLHPEDWRVRDTETVHRALTVAQLLVGRFFFIHQAQAKRDTDTVERSFEFLHATFGEFLAARQIVTTLTELADAHAHRPRATLDAGPLYAATSFITIARRAPLWEFCGGFLDRLTPETRAHCRRLVLHLLPDAGYPHPTWTLAEYEPRRKPAAARHAAYSATLVCFAVLLADEPVDTVDLVGEPVVTRWRAQALLWQSQLDTEDRQRLWQMLRVRWDLRTNPTRMLIRVEDGSPISVYESLPWPPDERPSHDLMYLTADVTMPSDSAVGRALRRSAYAQTPIDVREHLYALIPYWRAFGDTATAVAVGYLNEPMVITNGGAVLDLLLSQNNSNRTGLYFEALRADGANHRRFVLAQLLRDAYLMANDISGPAVEFSTNRELISAHEASLIALANKLGSRTSPSLSSDAPRDRLDNLSQKALVDLVMLLMAPFKTPATEQQSEGFETEWEWRPPPGRL